MRIMLVVEFNPRLSITARLARRFYGDDPAHGWPHIERVMGWAERIIEAEGLNVDLEVLAYNIILHDLGRTGGNSRHHALESAEIADIILEILGYDREFRSIVLHAILAHSYTLGYVAESIEAMVLSDADKLDALGAVGIARVFHTEASMNRSFKDSIEHFKEKILKLKDLMYLEYSRREAELLTVRIQEYLNWWREEVEYVERES